MWNLCQAVNFNLPHILFYLIFCDTIFDKGYVLILSVFQNWGMGFSFRTVLSSNLQVMTIWISNLDPYQGFLELYKDKHFFIFDTYISWWKHFIPSDIILFLPLLTVYNFWLFDCLKFTVKFYFKSYWFQAIL